MREDKAVKLHEIKQNFQLKDAEIKHLEQQKMCLETKSNVLKLELAQIKEQIIRLETQSRVELKQNVQTDTTDAFGVPPYLDVGVSGEDDRSTKELTFDFTQTMSVVGEESKDPTSLFITNIDNYLVKNK